MELLTKKEVESLTGLSERELDRYYSKYQKYFPVTVSPTMTKNGLLPRENLSFLLMLSELARSGDYSDEQLEQICKRVSGSRNRKKQMVAVEKSPKQTVEEIMSKLDMLLYGNHVLKKNSEGIRNDGEELKKKNEKMQKTLEKILAERKNMVRLLKEKDEKNKQLSKKITHLASAVLKLKRENQDLRHCNSSLEQKLAENEGTADKQLIASLERKLSDFERNHSNLVSSIQAESPVKASIQESSGLFGKIRSWFRKQSFENNYSI